MSEQKQSSAKKTTSKEINIEEQIIYDLAKKWFHETIISNHAKNIKKLKPETFTINPFIIKYLEKCSSSDNDSLNLAKALVYPRAYGTSITGSFGTSMQKFIVNYLVKFTNAKGSVTKGLDIEYTDKLDNRYKYCQIKAGPHTINNGDVKTIHGHFETIKKLAITNGLKIDKEKDLVVGLLYGDRNELSDHYKKLEKKYNYTVWIGQELWEHLTGDVNFYKKLIHAVQKTTDELDSNSISSQIEEKIIEISKSDGIKNIV